MSLPETVDKLNYILIILKTETGHEESLESEKLTSQCLFQSVTLMAVEHTERDCLCSLSILAPS